MRDIEKVVEEIIKLIPNDWKHDNGIGRDDIVERFNTLIKDSKQLPPELQAVVWGNLRDYVDKYFGVARPDWMIKIQDTFLGR